MTTEISQKTGLCVNLHLIMLITVEKLHRSSEIESFNKTVQTGLENTKVTLYTLQTLNLTLITIDR